MLNYIWFGMMAIAVAAGIYNGKIDDVTEAAIDMAEVSVNIAIGLIGIMALWLGIMKIAEESGLIRIIAKATSSPHHPLVSGRSLKITRRLARSCLTCPPICSASAMLRHRSG